MGGTFSGQLAQPYALNKANFKLRRGYYICQTFHWKVESGSLMLKMQHEQCLCKQETVFRAGGRGRQILTVLSLEWDDWSGGKEKKQSEQGKGIE